MDASAILRGLKGENHDERMRRMVTLGRESRSRSDVAAALATLAGGDFFERLLALQSVYGSRDGSAAARAAMDPSRTIRGRALRLVALYTDDAGVVGLLREIRPTIRLPLARLLRARSRFGPIDVFLDDLASREDRDLPTLLPFGSPSAVRQHGATTFERGAPNHWARLARFHPDEAVSLLERHVDSPASGGVRMRPEANAVLAVLARTRPDDAARLAGRLATRWPLGTLDLTGLARSRPRAVGALLAGSADEVGRLGPRPRPDRLEDSCLRALLAARPELFPQPERWLRHLRPERRALAMDAAGPAWRDASAAVSPLVLAHLPTDRRIAEARRHLALPALAASPALRLPYASLLPWDEARTVVAPFLGHPDAPLRAAALSALVGSVRYERDRLAEALALIQTRKNEQDPVRLAVLSALAALPTLAFGAEHLQATGQVLRQALDAADLSTGTAAAAQTVAVRLLARHPAWAAAWLETLVSERGSIELGDLASRWSDTQAGPLADVLGPLLKVWSRRERDAQIVFLARALGARLRTLEVLHPHLERIARESREWTNHWALHLLKRHAPDRYSALIPRLLRADRSWGTQWDVYSHLHRHRQDLLGPYLGRRAWRGRFSTGRTRFVLPLLSGFQRWTPIQQRTFARTLEEVTAAYDDRDWDTPTVLKALRQLASLPSVAPERLLALSDDEKRPAVRDGALRALARLDTDVGVGALVNALSHEGARVAAHALRRPVLDMPPADALRLLRQAPLRSLTVAKEVVRLVGDLRGDEAVGLLQAIAAEAERTAEGGRRPAHRDLRVALLRAYWEHLDRPEAWEAIERAAGEADPALVSGIIRMPSNRLSSGERERFASVLERLLRHPEPTVRCDVLARLVTDPFADADGRLLTAALSRLRSVLPTERAAAAQAVAAAASPTAASRVGTALVELAGDRRAQKALLEALTAWAPLDRVRLVPLARAAIAALEPDESTTPVRTALAVAALPGLELADTLEAFARSGSITADVLHAVVEGLAARSLRPTAAEIDELAARLEAHPDERLRRIALAGLVTRSEANRGPGWTPERLERLRAFRSDASTLVAAAARFTLPLAEESPAEAT